MSKKKRETPEEIPEWLREPRQWTPVRMLPIDTLYAVYLAERCAPDDADPASSYMMMELISGIAAIDNQMFRQELAYQVIRAVYQLTNEHGKEIDRVLAGIYKARGER